MEITLVRNGQTEEEFLNKIEGRKNNLMNDTGRRQCQNLRMKIKDKNYDLCYTSPLVKCVETAFILIGDRVQIIRDSRLIDRDMGELEGKNIEEYNKYKFWDFDLNKNDYQVEPIKNLFKRCDNFLEEVTKKKEEKILIVTHEELFLAFKHILLKKKLKGNLLEKKITNCSILVFEI